MKRFAFALCLFALSTTAYAQSGEWWSYDTEAKACLNDTTPQEQVAIFKEHDAKDVRLTYSKTARGEIMFADVEANDDGQPTRFYHAYHRGNILVSGKAYCEGMEQGKD